MIASCGGGSWAKLSAVPVRLNVDQWNEDIVEPMLRQSFGHLQVRLARVGVEDLGLGARLADNGAAVDHLGCSRQSKWREAGRIVRMRRQSRALLDDRRGGGDGGVDQRIPIRIAVCRPEAPSQFVPRRNLRERVLVLLRIHAKARDL